MPRPDADGPSRRLLGLRVARSKREGQIGPGSAPKSPGCARRDRNVSQFRDSERSPAFVERRQSGGKTFLCIRQKAPTEIVSGTNPTFLSRDGLGYLYFPLIWLYARKPSLAKGAACHLRDSIAVLACGWGGMVTILKRRYDGLCGVFVAAFSPALLGLTNS